MSQSVRVFQLKGPFTKNTELLSSYDGEIFKIGIFIPNANMNGPHFVSINGGDFEIGKTNVLEIKDTIITSLYFLQDEDQDSFIDFMTEDS